MAQPWGSGIPIIGNTIARFGKVGQILATPCATTPQIWVDAFFIGAAVAVWTLAKPSALAPYGSPASETVFGAHGRTRPTLKRRGNGFRYEFNGEIMPGPALDLPPGPGWRIWNVPIQLIRRVGWWLLVFDAVGEGLVAWTSTAYQYAGCPVPGVPFMFGTDVDKVYLPGSHGGHPGGFDPATFQNTGIAYGDGRVIVPPGHTYTVAASANSTKVGNIPLGHVGIQITNETTGQVVTSGEGKQQEDGSWKTAAAMRGGETGTQSQTIRIDQTFDGNGAANTVGSICWIQADANRNLLADP